MSGSSGNSWFCFPESVDISRDKVLNVPCLIFIFHNEAIKNKTGNCILHIQCRKLSLFFCASSRPTSLCPSPHVPESPSSRPSSHIQHPHVPAHASHVPNMRPSPQVPIQLLVTANNDTHFPVFFCQN